MSQEADETIWIITSDTPETLDDDSSKAGNTTRNPWSKGSALTTAATKGVKVGVEKVEAEMSKFLRIVGGLLSRAQKQLPSDSRLTLDEIELSVEVNGEGEVKLLGTGGKAGTKGGITLKFKRNDSLVK